MIKEKKINDITLIYDTVKNKNIEEIENTIKLNPTLLNSYQGKNLSLVHIDKENTISIEDFDVFFQEQIKSLLNKHRGLFFIFILSFNTLNKDSITHICNNFLKFSKFN